MDKSYMKILMKNVEKGVGKKCREEGKVVRQGELRNRRDCDEG